MMGKSLAVQKEMIADPRQLAEDVLLDAKVSFVNCIPSFIKGEIHL